MHLTSYEDLFQEVLRTHSHGPGIPRPTQILLVPCRPAPLFRHVCYAFRFQASTRFPSLYRAQSILPRVKLQSKLDTRIPEAFSLKQRNPDGKSFDLLSAYTVGWAAMS